MTIAPEFRKGAGSSSASSSSEWSAGASVFSGRPDPVWRVDAEIGEEIVRLVGALRPADTTTRPDEPGLGYRGAWLRAPDGSEWRAAAGVVVAGDVRIDADGAVERAILATAPDGVLPSWSTAGPHASGA